MTEPNLVEFVSEDLFVLRKGLIFFLLLIMVQSCQNNNMTRVERAYSEKGEYITDLLNAQNIHSDSMEIFMRAFKKEQILEVWAKNQKDSVFQKITEYNFCNFSGDLGPKRREGDRQIPEGFYHIDRFNPKSKFHLSLGLNYPNASDLILSDKDEPGSHIFIHGGCRTVGCIPITDDKIREVWVLAETAKNNGQKDIQVHIFPTKMTAANLKIIESEKPEFKTFWRNLKPFYDRFEKEKSLSEIRVSEEGLYYF